MAAKKKPVKKTTKTATGSSALAKARAAIAKNMKGRDDEVQLDVQSLRESAPHFPSGSVIIDYLIGGKPNKYGVPPCPGIPRERIMNLYGNPGAGKTTLALTAAASVCELGGTCCYIDWENEVEPRYAEILGVPVTDTDRFMLVQPTTLEDGIRYAAIMAKEGVDLIVLDSVGAGVPEAWFTNDDTPGKGRIGLVASIWSQELPKLKSICSKTGTAIIGISQLRTNLNITGYGGPKDAAQGGKAWKFYSATRMMLSRIQGLKEKVHDPLSGKIEEVVVGQRVKARLDKCKVSDAMNRTATFILRSGYGIDDDASIVEIALAHNIITRAGSWYSWVSPDGTEVRGQGMGKFRTLMDARDGSFNELWGQISPILSAAVDSSAVENGTEEEEDADAQIEILGV